MYVCRLVVPSRVRSQSHSIFLIHDSSIHPLRSTTPIAHQSKLIINSIHHRFDSTTRVALTARRTPRRRLPTSTQFDDDDAFDDDDDDAFDDDAFDDDDDDENNQQEFIIIIDRRSSETDDARTRRDARTSREHRDERVFDLR